LSELRQDRTTGTWVIIAPGRSRRPQPDVARVERGLVVPASNPSCPFCPGNEALLPPIIAETPGDKPPGWQIRVVPNKFPALQPDNIAPVSDGVHAVSAGKGAHEVIIETARHDLTLATLDDAALAAVVLAYRDRFTALAERPGIETVVLYRNQGMASGASIGHPHAQLIALAHETPKLAAMSAWGRRYHGDHGQCVTCDEIAFEIEHGDRVVDLTEYFVALVPFAAAEPGEIWLVPRHHQACFGETCERALADFGRLLRGVLRRLATAYNDPPYNFAIESGGQALRGAPHLHWRLRIAPHLVTWGGFELGAGMPINPSRPEDDAALLRTAHWD